MSFFIGSALLNTKFWNLLLCFCCNPKEKRQLGLFSFQLQQQHKIKLDEDFEMHVMEHFTFEEQETLRYVPQPDNGFD